jgi:hypothetical protein
MRWRARSIQAEARANAQTQDEAKPLHERNDRLEALVCHFQEPPNPPTRHFRAVLSLPARTNQETGFIPTPRYGRGSDLEVILEVIGSADRLPY